jgi:aminotransferase
MDDRPSTRSRAVAGRVGLFIESVIREMTRLADDHGAINLAQGFPDFDAPPEIRQAAQDAIASGLNQYPVTWGTPEFREAISQKSARFGWPAPDPEIQMSGPPLIGPLPVLAPVVMRA